jgi:hypothetical protein
MDKLKLNETKAKNTDESNAVTVFLSSLVYCVHKENEAFKHCKYDHITELSERKVLKVF